MGSHGACIDSYSVCVRVYVTHHHCLAAILLQLTLEKSINTKVLTITSHHHCLAAILLQLTLENPSIPEL